MRCFHSASSGRKFRSKALEKATKNVTVETIELNTGTIEMNMKFAQTKKLLCYDRFEKKWSPVFIYKYLN